MCENVAGWCNQFCLSAVSSMHLTWSVMTPKNPTSEKKMSVHRLYHFRSLVSSFFEKYSTYPIYPSIPFMPESTAEADAERWLTSAPHILAVTLTDPPPTPNPNPFQVPRPLFPLHVLFIQHVVCSCLFGPAQRVYKKSSTSQMRNMPRQNTATHNDYSSGPLGRTDRSCGPTPWCWCELSRKIIHLFGFFCAYYSEQQHETVEHRDRAMRAH